MGVWDACEEFCLKWDQAAFDGEYECKELEFFVPMVHRVLAKPVDRAALSAVVRDVFEG